MITVAITHKVQDVILMWQMCGHVNMLKRLTRPVDRYRYVKTAKRLS